MASDTVEAIKSLHLPSRFDVMPFGWSWSRLDDVCNGVFDCPHSTPKLVETGPFVVRTQDIITGVFRAEQAAHVSEETYTERTSRVVPSRGDLLYSREGTYFGIAAEVPERTRVCLGQRMVLIRPKAETVDFRFLCRWLNSPIMASHIHGYRDGTVAERLNLPTIRALPVLIPSLPEQDAIANILGVLDDKIELNRRMNETLEGLARAIFQSWFVDFDPVRAQRDGLPPPALSPTTAALFPDSFEDSELGKIPKGWTPIPLPNAFDFKEGPGLRNWQYTEEGMRFLNIRCIVDGDLETARANCISLEEFHATYKHFALQADDVVISTSGTLGRVAIVREDHLPVMLNTSIIRMRGIAPYSVFFVRAYLQSAYFLDEMFAAASGSVQLNFGPMHLNRMVVLRPSDPVLDAFEQRVEPLVRRVLRNRQESNSLAAIRDALLPKLLSGEIRVAEAERLVEDAG